MLSKDFLNEEATFESNKIVKMENKLSIDDLIYKTGNKKRIKNMIFKFHISHIRISQKVNGVIMRNLRHIIFYVKTKIWLNFNICLSFTLNTHLKGINFDEWNTKNFEYICSIFKM